MGLVQAPDGSPRLWGEHRIAMPSCAGPGKSAVLAWAGQWVMACFSDPANERYPKGAAVAIDRQNLRDNLWAEMALWLGRSEYLSEIYAITSTKYYAKGFEEKPWFISARAWPKRADAGAVGRTLSGLHAPWVIALMDESAEMPVPLMRTAEQMFSTMEYGAILQAGNCVTRDGMLHAAITKFAAEWLRVHITADPDDPKRTPRVPAAWARKWIGLLGRADPWVMAFILGQFPESALNTLLTDEDVEQAMQRDVKPAELVGRARVLGVDPAGEGMDLNVIFRRQGRASWRPWARRTVSSTLGARIVADHWTDFYRDQSNQRADAAFMDNTGGYAGGWLDRVRDDFGFDPQGVNFSGKPIDERYGNTRAEIWFLMAEWIKDGGALPATCRELIGELTIPRYYIKRDKFWLEDKDQIRTPARLGRSPDFADALALTFTAPVEAGTGAILDPGQSEPMLPWKRNEPQKAIMDDDERYRLL